jgi:hypothetical protein
MATPYRLRAQRPTSTATATTLLGAHVRSFHAAAHRQSAWAASPFVLLLAYVVWLMHKGELGRWFNSGFSAFAVAAIFVLAVALIMYTAAVGGGELVRVHQDGLLDLRAGPRAVRWDEIESLTPVVDSEHDVIRHLLRTSDGTTLSLGRSIGMVDELVDVIRARLVEERGAALMMRIGDGEVLQFGPIQASEQGVAIGDRVIAWSDVEDIEAEGSEIQVRGQGGSRLAAAPLCEVPNAFLLAEIVHGRRSGHDG